MATLRSEIVGMKVGATRVFKLGKVKRSVIFTMCSILKREIGQTYHAQTDFDNKLIIVTRES